MALRDVRCMRSGLGFIWSMVMAHAPVILPAVARVKVLYGPWFYGPLLVMHASLLLRCAGGWGVPTCAPGAPQCDGHRIVCADDAGFGMGLASPAPWCG
jgi:hypothetical protein